MSALPIRQKIEAELNELSDTQAITVLEFIRSIKRGQSEVRVADDDPMVGFISGPTDLAERTEEILRSEFGQPNSRNSASE